MNLVRGKFRLRGDSAHPPAGLRRARRPHRLLRRRGRAHHRDRPADRRDAGRARRDRHLPGEALRHVEGQAGAGDRRHRGGAGGAAGRASRARASCSKPRGSKSAPATTSRACARPATAPASRTTRGTSRAAAAGSTPWTLLDYFPDDWLLFIDESHIAMPQVRGMFHGDLARKTTLVDFGFRLPSRDRQPAAELRGVRRPHQPGRSSSRRRPGRTSRSTREQVGRADHPPDRPDRPRRSRCKPTKGQIDDLLDEIRMRVGAQRAHAGHDADQEDGRGPGRLPAGDGRPHPLPPLRDRHAGARRDPARPAPRRLRRASSASTCCARASTCRR